MTPTSLKTVHSERKVSKDTVDKNYSLEYNSKTKLKIEKRAPLKRELSALLTEGFVVYLHIFD